MVRLLFVVLRCSSCSAFCTSIAFASLSLVMEVLGADPGVSGGALV